ncbi:MAG: hypothetical protein J0I79_11790 [Mesorhizobium sp.]|uniref:hypothetical protein n=1 Tax=Mesorhizobium sp. TaxID=1871066 RepID=UPI001ACA0C82|nr:hypothetical protein [Mesorhizobium sp.]MBN9218626.1 hypothetical protein [Mesorhizobium sp.]
MIERQETARMSVGWGHADAMCIIPAAGSRLDVNPADPAWRQSEIVTTVLFCRLWI